MPDYGSLTFCPFESRVTNTRGYRINFETRRLHEDVRRRMRQGESRRRDRVLTGRPSTSREHEPLLGIGVTDYGTAA